MEYYTKSNTQDSRLNKEIQRKYPGETTHNKGK